MLMVNISHVAYCFIDCFLEQVFQETWVLSIKGRYQPNSTLTTIMVMNETHVASAFQCAVLSQLYFMASQH